MADTPCKDCFFAVYEGKTQVGCSAGRLEINTANHGIIEAMDFDMEKSEFYVIEGPCFFKRSAAWGKLHEEDPLGAAEAELSLVYDAIVLMRAEPTLDLLRATVDSLLVQKPRLRRLHVIRSVNCPLKPTEIKAYLDSVGVPFVLRSTIDCKMTDDQAIGLVGQFTECVYSIFEAGYIVPDTFFSLLNKATNEARPFVLLTNDELSGTTVFGYWHKHLGNSIPKMLYNAESSEKWLKQIVPLAQYLRQPSSYLKSGVPQLKSMPTVTQA